MRRFYRHWGHILLGIALPWIPEGVAITLTLLFLGYEGLQYLHHSKWMRFGYCYHDDSYLDIKETAIYCGISAGVLIVLKSIGVL